MIDSMLAYVLIVLYLGPWLLFSLGAETQLRRDPARTARMQRYAMHALVASTLLMALNFDPNIGFDYYGVKPWSYPLLVADSIVFRAGILIFGLGYFLERRPGPDFKPWPKTGKSICMLSILCGSTLGWWASRNVHLPWIDLPWSIARFVVSLGFWPTAMGYFLFRWRQGHTQAPYETGAAENAAEARR